MLSSMRSHSLYIHIPFCQERCAYCDFNTYAHMERWVPDYTNAVCREIDQVAAMADDPVPIHTIFFGGGTPSLLTKKQIEMILNSARRAFQFSTDIEINMEANPGTVTLEYLQYIRNLGVNRLSFGMQSADEAELRFLTRIHGLQDVVNAVEWAREAGFDNLNLDLIFGLPGQKIGTWQSTLNQAISMMPDHLSLYALTVEAGTPLKTWVEQGRVAAPDDDIAADEYELATQRLTEAGFLQYEISNWAKPDWDGEPRACQHNLQYWFNFPYLGVGAGAHGYAGGVRTANIKGIVAYIKRMRNASSGTFPVSSAVETVTPIDLQCEMGETMMVGLRLTNLGVSSPEFQERFGISLTEKYSKPIRKLQEQGLLEWTDGPDSRLRLTPRGRLFGNRVFREFL
jgi:oxygen-independent coproporphyrinogen-3 oxidase